MVKLSTQPPVLKDSEINILQLLAGGQSSKEIGDELQLSHRTVETKIAMIRAKLGAVNTPHLISLSYEYRILGIPEFPISSEAGKNANYL